MECFADVDFVSLWGAEDNQDHNCKNLDLAFQLQFSTALYIMFQQTTK